MTNKTANEILRKKYSNGSIRYWNGRIEINFVGIIGKEYKYNNSNYQDALASLGLCDYVKRPVLESTEKNIFLEAIKTS